MDEDFKLIEILTLSVKPVDKLVKQKWISNSRVSEGGYYRNVVVRPDPPLVRVDFTAITNAKLDIGAMYFDGENTFVAINKNNIILKNMLVKSFSLPKFLHLMSTPYVEGREQPVKL